MADIGAVSYIGSNCTPRSLIVPAVGLPTLHPSQRVSTKELEAKDRAWRRQQERQTAHDAALSRQVSYPPSYVTTTSRDAGAAEYVSGAKRKRPVLVVRVQPEERQEDRIYHDHCV